MRFEDPVKFLEFFDKQLSHGVVGLRHTQSVVPGTPFLVVVSPPGAPDRLLYQGRVSRVSQRPDGAWRLRVELQARPEDAVWLEGYVEGLRITLAWHPPPTKAVVESSLEERLPVATSSPPPVATVALTQAPAAAPEEIPMATPKEISALAIALEHADYYALLGVPRTVDPEVLQQRFHYLTRRFHPDLFHGMERKMLQQVNRIYRRMNEAYSVLKNPPRRRAYDAGLERPDGGIQIRLAEEAQDEARRKETIQGGHTGQGEFYWARARTVLESARTHQEWLTPARQEAVRLLRTALFFEPDNVHFRSALDHVKGQLPRV